jgi:L-alanine-DL-glutamate epimerase-like enolase superfamily enzyme
VRITDVDCHILLASAWDRDATSSAQDSFIVEVHTDEGISGIGESDLNPWIARACIEAPGTHTMGLGIKEMLLGLDPLDPRAVWQRLYVGSAMNGRRGAVVNAMGAIDIALWDIAGKAAGVPCWQLLGPAAKDRVVPYASLQPDSASFAAYRSEIVEWAGRAVAAGFTAVKLELTFDGPYRHLGMTQPDERMTEIIGLVRAAVGEAVEILIDVQYRWSSFEDCLPTLRDWAPYRPFFVETPLWTDDLAGYGRLHDAQIGTRIAAGEWLSTHHEFRQLMDEGKVDVAQPDVGRVGGLTEAMRVVDLAAERGRLIVPHAWKTAVSLAAALHMAVVTPHCPFVEYLPPALTTSMLRRELASLESEVDAGTLPLPSKPGLGVDLDRAALRRFSENARLVAVG